MDTATLTTVAPLVVLAGVGLTLLRRTMRASGRRRTAAEWATAPGTIVASTIQVSRTGKTRHEVPAVAYTYVVGGTVLTGTRVRVGDELGRTRIAGTGSSAADTVARYPVGATVTVFYDPSDPTSAALER